jgi:hypothetical protein
MKPGATTEPWASMTRPVLSARSVRLDGDDAAGADGHIGHAGRRAGAVDHLAAPDQDVVIAASLSRAPAVLLAG